MWYNEVLNLWVSSNVDASKAVMFLTRTVKRRNILKVKNALSMPVQHDKEYTTWSFVILLDSLGELVGHYIKLQFVSASRYLQTITQNRIRCVQHVARMGQTINKFVGGKKTERGYLGALSAERTLIMKESELVGWIHLAQNRNQWLFLANAAVNIRVLMEIN